MKALAAVMVLVAATSGAFGSGPRLGEWKVGAGAAIRDGWLAVDVPAGGKAPAFAGARAAIDLSEYDGRGFMLEVDLADLDVDRMQGTTFEVAFTDRGTGRRIKLKPWQNETKAAKLHYDVTSSIGLGRDRCELSLGLEGTHGKVRFDLGSLKIRPIRARQRVPEVGFKAQYSERVRSLPQLKGMMMGTQPTICEDDVKTLASWGGCLARYQICMEYPRGKTLEEDLASWRKRFCEHLANLDQVLGWARKYGMLVQVDMHVPPGGRYVKEDAPVPLIVHDMKAFHVEEYAREYIRAWETLAIRCRGNRTVYGYDLVNEPDQKPAGDALYSFWELQDAAIRAIRAIDPDTPIIVSAAWGDDPIGFLNLAPFPYRDIIYQVHMYRPQMYTLQGWGMSEKLECKENRYPNPDAGIDIGFIRREMEPVIDFARTYGARIVCGEWSCVMWAAGCDRYQADCIAVFDELKWDWAYGCIREWEAWSIEHDYKLVEGKKVFVPSADNPRKRVMLKGLKNQLLKEDSL